MGTGAFVASGTEGHEAFLLSAELRCTRVMNKKDAILKGFVVHDTKHTMKRRSLHHDYRGRGTYMLTLVVEGRRPLLGRIVEVEPSAELRGTGASLLSAELRGMGAIVEKTELGRRIEEEEVKKIKLFYPMVDVWKVCIMPDHIHLIVRVNEDLPEGLHLGKIIAGFKQGCNRAYWGIDPSAELRGTRASLPSAELRGTETSLSSAELRVIGARRGLFEAGYNDKILLRDGQLENWKAYLDDNPRRLLIKRKNPHLFTVIRNMRVAGKECQVVGNSFLLDVPDKVAVIVHRRYTEMEITRLREEWLACGERGGVLVSAAISPDEKEVLREAMNLEYRIILLRENGFPELYKPSGESFYACSEGRLLQVSPWGYHTEKKTISREQCLELNAMAEMIAETPQRN